MALLKLNSFSEPKIIIILLLLSIIFWPRTFGTQCPCIRLSVLAIFRCGAQICCLFFVLLFSRNLVFITWLMSATKTKQKLCKTTKCIEKLVIALVYEAATAHKFVSIQSEAFFFRPSI